MKNIKPWHVVAIVCLLYVSITLLRNNFDPLRFALIGSQYDPGVANGTPGYDGQFAYQIARDPANGWTKIDVPAYRYQRIVYPIAARVLARGYESMAAVGHRVACRAVPSRRRFRSCVGEQWRRMARVYLFGAHRGSARCPASGASRYFSNSRERQVCLEVDVRLDLTDVGRHCQPRADDE